MIKKKIAKKGITAMAVMSMMASIVPSGPLFLAKAEENGKTSRETSSNVSAESLNVDVDFFDYNINSAGDKTAKNRILLNDYMIDKFTSNSSSLTEKNIFLFGGDRHRSDAGAHNVWTGAGKGPYQGIVSRELASDGSLQFNNDAGIYGVDMFPDEGDTELEGMVNSYYDTNFQFLDDDGTYIFDSNQFCASGLRKNTDGAGSLIDIDFNANGPVFKSGTGSAGHTIGFFPFNNITDTNNKTNEQRHHMFGMKMELDFYMPKDGKIGTKSNPDDKNDMVFSFSGDDDVWVYIDGKLALDLGGIHDVVSGSINFATGEVESTKNESKISHNITNIYEDCGIEDVAYSKHTLTMFYIERGEYDSNCKITFNLPSLVKTDDIAITKKAEGVPEEKIEEYKFKLLYGTKGEVEKEDTAKVFEGEYTVYDASNKEIGKEEAKNGIISLAAGETAVVSKEFVGEKQYYKVKELLDDPHYETEWGATGLTADEGSATYGDGTETTPLASGSEDGEGNTIIFTNKYKKWTNFTLEKALAEGVENRDKFEFLVTIGEKEERVVLEAGEAKTWDKIPAGTAYEVKELVTGGSIYTTPDVTVDELNQTVAVEENVITKVKQDVFVVSGSVLQTKEEGAETKVLYTNKVKEVPEAIETPTPEGTETPTPEATKTPTPEETETPTPEATKTPTPEVTKTPTPEVTKTPTPEATKTPTPEATKTPMPGATKTPTPEATKTPMPEPTKTATPEPTKTPTVTPKRTPSNRVTTPKVKTTVTPVVTDEPTATPVVTEKPTATPKPTSTSVILEEPTQLPLSPIVPADEETVAPELTAKPTAPLTDAPTEGPTPKPTEMLIELNDSPELPNAPVAEDDEEDDGTDADDNGYNEEEEYESDDADDSESDVEIIEYEDIPNELPQTGGLGTVLTQKNKGIYALIAAVFASGIAMGVFFVRRRIKK